MINLKILNETKTDDYFHRTYQYDYKTKISVTKGKDLLGEYKGITLLHKQPQIIPHEVNVVSPIDENKHIELNIQFNTPIYLTEFEEIKKLFDYYQNIENYINKNYNKFWLE